MSNTAIKQAVADKFAELGIWMSAKLSMREIEQKVAEHTGKPRAFAENQYGYLARFAQVKPRVAGGYRPEFRALIVRPHPRAAEIDQAQPPLMTPRGGIGNGSERSLVWRR